MPLVRRRKPFYKGRKWLIHCITPIIQRQIQLLQDHFRPKKDILLLIPNLYSCYLKNEKLSPLNNPLSLNLMEGITRSAIKLKVINGAANVQPKVDFTMLSILI